VTSEQPKGGVAQERTADWAEAAVREHEEQERAAHRPGAEHLSREQQVLERIERARRRRPRVKEERITLAHGSGGKATQTLIEAVFLDAFRNPLLEPLEDAATLVAGRARLAFTTDSFVVSPLFFPGGDIGDLAVNGTVNDLAVSGARPLWLSAGFILEEGFPVADLQRITASMRAAADRAGVQVVTGDTKVVPRGAADGLFVSTAGIGVIPAGRALSAQSVRAGDKVLLSGSMGDHGMAVMLARGDLAIEADIASDTACLSPLVELLMAAAPSTRWMRDATRGGVGTVCNELAQACGLGVLLDEERLPVAPMVTGACELLGIDPLYVANEGKFVAVVAPQEAQAGLDALRSHPLGADAAVVGEIVTEPAESVVLRTGFGGTRIVDMLVGDPLPRIC
jgi:hydrogenase expression/formation protein HypE